VTNSRQQQSAVAVLTAAANCHCRLLFKSQTFRVTTRAAMTPSVAAAAGPLELLVLQPTPFCNINCSYCYLPDRQSTKKMSSATLRQSLDWVFASGLVREPFSLLWHAGEPLVMPVDFYEEAVALLGRANKSGVRVDHSFQTNATLIDARSH